MSGITMRDIGRQLGVSAVTVSKALAGKSGVSEEMRQKIIRRASELGYVNPNAPQTTPTSGLDVGILIPENFFSVVSFYATFYKQLVQALTNAGHFGIMELVTHDMQTALTLPNLLRSRHVDAMQKSSFAKWAAPRNPAQPIRLSYRRRRGKKRSPRLEIRYPFRCILTLLLFVHSVS